METFDEFVLPAEIDGDELADEPREPEVAEIKSEIGEDDFDEVGLPAEEEPVEGFEVEESE